MNTNNNNQANNNNQVYSPTVHSGYKFFNSGSRVDKTSLSFEYWNGLLKVIITPIIVQEGSPNKMDDDNAVAIYMSPSRAYLFLKCLKEFRRNPDKYTNLGVPTNKGVIYIANGSMFNDEGILLGIDLIDASGNVTAKYAYHFTSELFALENYTANIGIGDQTKYTDCSTDLEVDMLEIVLDQYIKSATAAMAASVMDANKFNDNRLFSFIKDVKEKLGITSSGRSNSYNKSSWLNSSSATNNNNSGTRSTNDTVKPNQVDYNEMLSNIESLME